MTFTLKIATCHPHFWWNGWDHLHATAITQGWKGYRKKSQHRNLTLEKKFSHRSCWDLNQRPFNHRSILLPYPHLSSKNDATYAVWISSNFLWLANSLNISTFLHYGMGALCVWHMCPPCFVCWLWCCQTCALYLGVYYLRILSFLSQILGSASYIKKCLLVSQLQYHKDWSTALWDMN